jgi:hypothetical protein
MTSILPPTATATAPRVAASQIRNQMRRGTPVSRLWFAPSPESGAPLEDAADAGQQQPGDEEQDDLPQAAAGDLPVSCAGGVGVQVCPGIGSPASTKT